MRTKTWVEEELRSEQGLAGRSLERRLGSGLPLEACAQTLAKQRKQGGSAQKAAR